ncbi:aldehyde reductase AKR1 [Aspergillus sclerotialis]|uniref:D-xylose reductase [NAD(P)H] n=1 Tax=Aspergillus sclerotialis TaxID=2070753 RepID=A0A3A2ZWI8_9EURO|nr:aldehyde reductase AKR1 [Aspergillus sclerotialis]
MTFQQKHFKLNTGALIPAIGLGTWQDEDAQEAAVTTALKAGYRHIDTARCYGTEKPIGNALRQSGVPRDQIFITSKLWNNKHHPDDVPQALDDTLSDLGVDYIDLFLMHWPVAFQRGDDPFPSDKDGKLITADIDYVDTYKAMEGLVKSGKAKAIGISNFSRKETERLLAKCSMVPAVHQLELHPWLQQREFVKYLESNGIHVTHYSPLGNQNALYGGRDDVGRLVDDNLLNEIGKKYGKTGAQVALAWGVSQGHSVIPKSKTVARIHENLLYTFELSSEDMEKISSIDKKLRFNDSSKDFGYELFADLDGKQK